MNNSDDQSAFVRELESIARSQGARFVDNSAATEKDLDRIGNPNVEKILKRPVINVGMQRDDGVALIATNVGVPDCQVAVGFTDGAKSSDARSFANMVVSKLEHHWRVEPVTP